MNKKNEVAPIYGKGTYIACEVTCDVFGIFLVLFGLLCLIGKLYIFGGVVVGIGLFSLELGHKFHKIAKSIKSVKPVPTQYKAPASQSQKIVRETRIESFNVAGVTYRQDAILSLPHYESSFFDELTINDFPCEGVEGKLYKEEFDIKKVQVLPEPDNEYDSNALKVLLDGIHVGYIKKEDQQRMNELFNLNILGCVADVRGGQFKMLIETDDGRMKIWKGSDDNYIVNLRFQIEVVPVQL